jgi:glycerol kinase
MALWQATKLAISDCLEMAGNILPDGVAITNQRESVLVWDKRTGEPVGPMIIWQCRRTAPFCAELRKQGLESLIHQKTGLTIDPLFSASKARWLIDQIPDGQTRADGGELCVGTVDTWLLWHLTGGREFRTDVSNAARTQLLNLETATWDSELLKIFGIPEVALPEILPSSALFGVTAGIGQLFAGIPISGIAGDSHAALFGQAGFRPGSAKATYGTGSSLMTPIDRPLISENGLSTTIAWGLPDTLTYALEGNITVTGAAVQWLANLFGLENEASVADLAATVEGSDGVYVVPAFAGLGAPHWNEGARGLISGITRGTGPAQIARAVMESIAFQIRDVFDLMAAESEKPLTILLADGGASRNDLLMQFQADILDRPVDRNKGTDISALGVAYMAGLHLGTWQTLEEVESLPRSRDRFEPAMQSARREELYQGWRQAISRTLHRADLTTSGPEGQG